MPACKKEQTWFAYYKENMDALGLPCPPGWYATKAEIGILINTMVTAIKTVGHTATVGELIGATTRLEKMAVLAAFGAVGVLGAMVGSVGVATSRYMSCGTALSDVMLDLHDNGIYIPGWLYAHLQAHPEVYGKGTLAAARAYITKVRK